MAGFRTFLFWCHLSSGVAAALIVFSMSITGVLLTYERQILAAEAPQFVPAPDAEAPLPIEQLKAIIDESSFRASSVSLSREPNAPVTWRAGRRDSIVQNPYTGKWSEPAESSLAQVFGFITRFHRWFDLSGDARATGRAITGVSNLLFLFLLFSGLYLWLPKVYRWGAFKLRLKFVTAPSSAARDFNWHHVLGFWFAIPLVVIIASGTVFGYNWASNLVYFAAGEEPPSRGGARIQ
ncbi:hypothetical protein NBRC116494_07520 [Aurantivibrio plasticivorans]